MCWRVSRSASSVSRRSSASILGRLRDQSRAAQADDRLMKGDVGIRILVEMLRGRGALELIEQMAQLADFHVACMQRRQARRHALQRRPHLDHLDDLALGFSDDEDATPWHRPDKALLLQDRQCLAHRRSTHAQRLHQLPLIESQGLALAVYVGAGDGVLE